MSGNLSQFLAPAVSLGSAAPIRAWTNGRITAFVQGHRLAWELATAGLTIVYVVLAFLQDQGSSGLEAGQKK